MDGEEQEWRARARCEAALSALVSNDVPGRGKEMLGLWLTRSARGTRPRTIRIACCSRNYEWDDQIMWPRKLQDVTWDPKPCGNLEGGRLKPGRAKRWVFEGQLPLNCWMGNAVEIADRMALHRHRQARFQGCDREAHNWRSMLLGMNPGAVLSKSLPRLSRSLALQNK